MGVLLQQLANALCVGSLYALLAIGYTMVYGVLRLINFAHGEIFMMAMYIVFYGIGLFLLPWYIGFTATILITALLGVLSERLAYRPLRDAPRISVLISAIGVSYFLQNLATVVFGGRPLTFPDVPLFTKVIDLGGVKMQRLGVLVPAITAVLLLALLDYMGLLDAREEPAGSLPYGKQRKLEIARALATQPSLLLLDEPAAGMNPSEAEELKQLIRGIRDRFHIAILLIEHHMDVVMGISDRIYVLNYGTLIASGSAREIQNDENVISAYLGVSDDDA